MSRFVLQTAQAGPPELPTQLPIAGRTITVLTDPRGTSAFHAVLDVPLRFYLGQGNVEDRHAMPERVGRDERGPFLWVGEIVMSSHRADEQPYPGMTNFPMDVRAVLSPGGADAPVGEIATAALGIIAVDDVPEAVNSVPGPLDAAPPARAEVPAARPVAPTPLPSSGAPPVPTSAATADGAAVTEAAAQRGVAQLRGQIAALLGWPLTEIAEPKCVKAGREKKQGGPAYSASRGTLRYFTNDVWDGFVLRETTDLDELLYWIADDVTRSAAWEWTTRTPSFDTVDRSEARRVIAMPMWQTLMHALRYDWGRRTRANAQSRSARARGA